MIAIREIRRGVSDPAGVSAFYGWLLGLDVQAGPDGYRLACSNGDLVFHGDVLEPVGMGLVSDTATPPRTVDPDGVPVELAAGRVAAGGGEVALDHVRLNCADLGAAVAFYQRLGFVVTWSESGDDLSPGEQRSGRQDTPVGGATWAHLSGDDGYLSLSQADWEQPSRESAASGPPRFMHVGLAVADLSAIRRRVEQAGLAYRQGQPPEGRNLYLNDPEGDEPGTNIELIEYTGDAERSGRLGHRPSAVH